MKLRNLDLQQAENKTSICLFIYLFPKNSLHIIA